jgi:hypothetical protein
VLDSRVWRSSLTSKHGIYLQRCEVGKEFQTEAGIEPWGRILKVEDKHPIPLNVLAQGL